MVEASLNIFVRLQAEVTELQELGPGLVPVQVGEQDERYLWSHFQEIYWKCRGWWWSNGSLFCLSTLYDWRYASGLRWIK
jgi:hypothetical protein